ncbi:MAG TPA: hypothetical protein VF603_02100 [Allosphingosinicella sp.]|jgi:hypothetical protein
MKWLGHALMRPALQRALAAGIFLLATGISLLVWNEASHSLWLKLPGLFLSELAFALIIAVMIFVVLEEEAAREHSKSVLGYLYRVSPRGKFFKKIQDHVLKKKFYRDKTVVTYRFLERHADWYLISYTLEYTVSNVSEDEEEDEFLLTGSVEMKPIHGAPSVWDDHPLGLSSIEINDDEVAAEKIRVVQGRTDRCQDYHLTWPLPIRKSLRIKTVHHLVKHDHDSEIWVSTLPALSVELRVEWSEGLHLEVNADPIHPEPAAMKVINKRNGLRVVLNEPFLVHHGIHFSWTSASPQAPLLALTSAVDRSWAGPGHD